MVARNWILCLTMGCAMLDVAKASGPLYRLTPIGGPEVTATAINNAGAVTGSIVTATGTHAFRWDGGVMTDLGTIAGYEAVGLAINDVGQIVGNLTPQQGTGSLPFLYSNGVMTVLPTLDAGKSWCCYGTADAINNNGQVGGSSGMSSAAGHVAVIWTNGVPQALGKPIPAGSGGAVFGINDYGQATGIDGVGPFVYSDGIVTYSSGGVAINNAGQVVGDYWTCSPAGCLPAWFVRLYANGSFKDLVGGGDDNGAAGGINNAGQVVLYAVTAGLPPPILYLFANGLVPFYDLIDPTDPLYSPELVLGNPGGLPNTNRPAINDDGWIVTRGEGVANNYLLIPVTPYPGMVQVSAYPSTVATGAPFTVAWTDQSVTACTASGGSSGDGWGGRLPTHGGNQRITENTAGTYSFTITCTGASEPVVSTASVTVNGSPPPSPQMSSGGGGALDSWSLLGLMVTLLDSVAARLMLIAASGSKMVAAPLLRGTVELPPMTINGHNNLRQLLTSAWARGRWLPEMPSNNGSRGP